MVMYIKKDIKSLLPSGVFLIDLKEDPRSRTLNCVIDAESPVDLNLLLDIKRNS